MRVIVLGMVAAGLAVAAGAQAVDMPPAAKKHGCNACHAIDKKVVGPAWMDISRRYKGDPSAPARLGGKIINGGSGVWGAMPMPPSPKVSEAGKKEMVDFILRLAK